MALTAGLVPCSRCGRLVTPTPGTATVRCGQCWYDLTGDYPGKTAKQHPPAWLNTRPEHP